MLKTKQQLLVLKWCFILHINACKKEKKKECKKWMSYQDTNLFFVKY